MKSPSTFFDRRFARRASGLTALLLALVWRAATAQTIPLYTFSTTSGTYVPLTTGTPFAANSGGGTVDDGYSAPLPLPFSFQLGTNAFTSVTVSTNGYIGLGTHTVSDNYNVLRGTEDNVIAFTNIDLEPATGGSTYRTLVDGAAPNRVFKIEAADFQRYSGVGGPGKTGSAQVWLFEGSNDIEIHYGAYGGVWGNDQFQGRFDSVRVGLRGVGRTDLATTNGPWSAPVKVNSARAGMEMSDPNNNLPSNGQILRFAFPAGQDLTPPTIGAITLTPPAPACAPAAHVVSLAPTDASGIASVRLTYSVGGAAPTQVALTNSGGTWSGTIPAQGTAQVTWFVTVTDASPQANQSASAPFSYTDGTITVNAGPDQTVNVGSTSVLQASGSPRTALKIAEFTFNNAGTGGTSPVPTYLGFDDDFVEIANIGPVAVSLNGYQLEVKAAGAGVARLYTFPAAAAIAPRGVVVVHLGPGTDQPANNYYHTGGNEVLGSGADLGFLLIAPGGTVIDGVAVNNYSATANFPAGVWSGLGASSPSGIAGTALTATDTDSNVGWTTASAAARQTIGTYNAGLTNQPLPAVTWTGGVLSGPTPGNPLTTPVYTTPGSYTYTAILDQNGCTVTDQVTVTAVTPVVPVAEFIASTTTPTTTTIVTLTDQSTNLPDNWVWTFSPNTVTYVNGTTSSSQNPQVIFTIGGCYTVTLTATNSAGPSTRTKPSYICVNLAYCATNLQGSPCSSFNGQINNVSIATTTLSNLNSGCTSGNGQAYTIFPASGSTTATLTAGQSYSLTVQSSSTGSIGAWLDTNANGIFESSEFILVASFGQPPTPSSSTVSFSVPTAAVGGLVGFRVRNSVSVNSINAGDACATRFSGETEDYFVTLVPICALAAPTLSSNGPLCAGSTLTLRATAQPANTTYAWTGPNGFTSASDMPILTNVTTAAAGTYSLVISRGGCSAPAATLNVVVNAAPNAPAPFTVSRCGTGTVRLEITTVPPGVTYRWYAASTGGTPLTTAASYLTPSLTASTTYYVSAVATGCESGRTPVVAQINPLPVATLTADGPTTFCTGGSVTLTAGGGDTGATYVFKRNNVVIPSVGNMATASLAGLYTVTITNSTTCVGTSAALTITLTAQASAAFAYANATLCRSATQAVLPGITGTRGGVFSVVPATGLSLTTTTGAIVPATSTAGSYVVTYTVGTAPCDATQSQTITITDAPTAGFSYAPVGPVCAGSADTLTAVFVANASAGTFGATPAGLTLTAGTGRIVLATSQPGTYTITNTIAANGACAAASATTTLTVLAAPTAAITASGPLTFCTGGSVTLTATGGTTYRWSTGATTPTITVGQSGAYTVTAANAAGCETTSAPTNVTVNPVASAAFAYSASAYCQGSATPATVTVTGTTGGVFSATPAGLTLSAATGEIDLASSLSGTYQVTYAVGGQCPASSTQTVSLAPAPSSAFAYASPNGCAGSSATLSVQPAPGASLGTFSVVPATGLTLNATTGEISFSTSLPGVYTVTNTVAGGGGCAANSSDFTITLAPLPTLAITSLATAFCSNDAAVQLTGTVDGVAGVGTFSVNGVPATQFSPAALGAGTFTVTLAGSNGAGCSTTTTQQVIITASPTQPTVTSAPQSSGVVLLTSSAATGNQWFLNGGPIAGATGATYSVGSSAQNGNYTVVSTVGGCASTPSAAVNVTVTGVAADLAAAISFQLYPNPTTDGQVVLETAARTGKVLVMDALGREVYRTEWHESTAPHALDLRSLPSGIYSVRLTTVGAGAIRRLVRE